MPLYSYALFVALTACSIPVVNASNTMYVDNSCDTATKSCVEDSAQQWFDQTSGAENINVTFSKPTGFYNRAVCWSEGSTSLISSDKLTVDFCVDGCKAMGSEESWCTDTWCKGVRVMGETSPDGGRFYTPNTFTELHLIPERYPDAHTCKLVVMHELGHLMGINHKTRTDSNIMFPSIEPHRTECLKNDDLLGYCYKNDCRNVVMKPCKDD